MSWIQKLYETYDQCTGVGQDAGADRRLLPICHVSQNAQIEVVLDGQGNFLKGRGQVIERGDAQKTIVPCTEASGGRSGTKPVNHPLCDKLQYVAGDYVNFGGKVTSGFSKNPQKPNDDYIAMLSRWINSGFSHPKVVAIHRYVQKKSLIRDLVEEKMLFLDDEGTLLKTWQGDNQEAPGIFKAMPAGQSPENAFVRWRVESPGEALSATWEDQELMSAWVNFYTHQTDSLGVCLVTGKEKILAEQHPKRLRHGGDEAKLISSNDKSGFTFRGRFIDASQACGVGLDVTQKAHNALRWLIERQAYRNGDQVVVSWAVSGEPIPDPFTNSYELFGVQPEQQQGEPRTQGDAGQAFGRRLSKLIAGYRASLGSTNDIVVMGLDSATRARMAITFYRELTGSELLDRIQAWHEHVAWHQNYSKALRFVGAPAPKEIAQAAYGNRIDDKLLKATIERLLPCIVDGRPIPRDLVESTVRRTCNRAGLERWEWEKILGIACALYRGYFTERNYRMSLEPDRTTRDYLYGRLLAIAEHIEERALYVAGERRDTVAAKLMQRFADRPYSTWRTIEISLSPYKTRLQARRPAFLKEMKEQLDDIIGSFQREDFTDERRLTGEFLLGYHCQRQALWTKPDTEADDEDNNGYLDEEGLSC